MLAMAQKRDDNVCAVFVHAGAGYHSKENEKYHLRACTDAAKMAMGVLREGGSAVDAVEMAIKVLEDRKITNAGYGSNPCIDGVVECDATIVDEYGRSGAVGAVCQIRNPISLARVLLQRSLEPLSLRRVPPNLLVGDGARDFAMENGFPILPHDALVSPQARERWIQWMVAIQKAGQPDYPQSYLMDDYYSDSDEQAKIHSRAEHCRSMRNSMMNACGKRSSVKPAGRIVSPPAKVDLPTPTPSMGLSDSDTPGISEVHGTKNGYIDSPGSSPGLHGAQLSMTSGRQLLIPTSRVSSHKATVTDDDVVMLELGDAIPQNRAARRVHQRDGVSDSCLGLGLDQIANKITVPISNTGLDRPLTETDTPLLPGTDSSPLQISSSQPQLTSGRDESKGLAGILTAGDVQPKDQRDYITDTVGAIAVDRFGNIAAGSSSGGIGMKHRGRVGPAALVGVGTAVVPEEPRDKDRTTVATVCSGSGEHMATTMAASTCAQNLYYGIRKRATGGLEFVDDTEVMEAMIQKEFVNHPSVQKSTSSGAIGIVAVKKTKEGIWMYFGHNTDSFAVASMHSDERTPVCTMSRNSGDGKVALGARKIRTDRRR